MEGKDAISNLAIGNASFHRGDFASAIAEYVASLLKDDDVIAQFAAFNLRRAQSRYAAERKAAAMPAVCVCGWELSHNAAGRVHCLAEIYRRFSSVRIVGYHFSGYGNKLWAPLRSTTIPTSTAVINDLKISQSFVLASLDLVLKNPCDIAHISKPRAPGMLLGILYKFIWGAKVIVDVDDEELAFTGENEAIPLEKYSLSLASSLRMENFDGRAWTQISTALADAFDAITVVNASLQQRYGGYIIRHARNELLFRPSPKLRNISRQALNIPGESILIIFIGTPRAHKGLQSIANALASLHRNDIFLLIAGSFDDEQQKNTLKSSYKEIIFADNFSIDDIPKMVSAGDFCILLQDEKSLISRFQTPAKLSDALGMGIAVLGSITEGMKEFFAAGVIYPTEETTLSHDLESLINQENKRKELENKGHIFFTKELTIESNQERIKHIIGQVNEYAFSVKPRMLDFFQLFSETTDKNLSRTLAALAQGSQ